MKPAIADGHAVTIHYRLTLDDGSVADDSFTGEPLVYLHGARNIVPGLERQLEGRNVGDTIEVDVEPGEGYGEYDPQAEQTIPRSSFNAEVQLQPGMSFQMRARNGQPVTVWIRKIDGDDIVVTANHPLSGQRLNFKVEVVDVRRATPEEVEHGHVHGPGGHQH